MQLKKVLLNGLLLAIAALIPFLKKLKLYRTKIILTFTKPLLFDKLLKNQKEVSELSPTPSSFFLDIDGMKLILNYDSIHFDPDGAKHKGAEILKVHLRGFQKKYGLKLEEMVVTS